MSRCDISGTEISRGTSGFDELIFLMWIQKDDVRFQTLKKTHQITIIKILKDWVSIYTLLNTKILLKIDWKWGPNLIFFLDKCHNKKDIIITNRSLSHHVNVHMGADCSTNRRSIARHNIDDPIRHTGLIPTKKCCWYNFIYMTCTDEM